jgi:4-amino-4-deoxychorismate lyase
VRGVTLSDSNMRALVDGQPVDSIGIDDRGLAYGDGLFETLAVQAGRPCLWDRHLDRLTSGSRRLALACPNPRLLRDEAMVLARGHERAVLKIILTRTGRGRGYRPAPDAGVRRILALSAWPQEQPRGFEAGVAVRLCDTACGLSPALAGLKHLGRLEQVLARAEWDAPDVPEGLMRDPLGAVIEATQANLFLERQGRLATPRLDAAGVAGVVRGLAMDLAVAAGEPIREDRILLEDVRDADALYLTNSLIGVWRVVRFDDHHYDLSRPAHPVMARTMERAYGP